MPKTPLDTAHAAMEHGADAERLRFFERLADAELFVLLRGEPEGDSIAPEIFDVADGRFVLVFDREDRLAGFVGHPAPYAALSGRAIARMLAGQGVGMGLNLDVAPSSILIPAEAVDWLHATLAHRPAQIEASPVSVAAPGGLPPSLLRALDEKLATAAGLAQVAYLASVIYAPARPGHLLAFVGAASGAQDALAGAVGEALTFSGLDAGELDVGFFAPSDAITAKLALVGLRFDLPEPEPLAHAPRAPGMDPDAPPRLR